MIRAFVALIFAALMASPASATILFGGGEDVDFTCTGTCTTFTTAGSYRSAWSRLSYSVIATAADPPPSRLSTPAFTASTSIWVHGQWCNSASACATIATISATQLIRVFDSGGNPTLIIRATGTNNQVKISSRTSGGVFTDLVTCSSAFNAGVNQLDLFVNYGVSGTVALYLNSVQVCSFSGDVTNGDGSTTLNKVEFAGVTTGVSSAWSEIIVADSDTRAMGLLRLTPNGAGNAVQWSGVNPCTTIVNATAYNDATLSSSSASNELLQCTTTNTLPAGTWTVPAVVMSARLQRGATGPQTFNYVTRTGGSDFTNGSDLTLTTSLANYSGYVQSTNPDTLSAWATSDLTAVGFNIGLKSRP